MSKCPAAQGYGTLLDKPVSFQLPVMIGGRKVRKEEDKNTRNTKDTKGTQFLLTLSGKPAHKPLV